VSNYPDDDTGGSDQATQKAFSRSSNSDDIP
ncbi:uncharacterized protein METZ01_LOCUS484698, partial [marine metagenome]